MEENRRDEPEPFDRAALASDFVPPRRPIMPPIPASSPAAPIARPPIPAFLPRELDEPPEYQTPPPSISAIPSGIPRRLPVPLQGQPLPGSFNPSPRLEEAQPYRQSLPQDRRQFQPLLERHQYPRQSPLPDHFQAPVSEENNPYQRRGFSPQFQTPPPEDALQYQRRSPAALQQFQSQRTGQSSINPETDFGSSEQLPRFIICIDYGTTYTGAAWAIKTREPVKLEDVKPVTNWRGVLLPKVRSLYTYSPNAGDILGNDVDENAHVIRWSKLKLPKQSRLKALMELKSVLVEIDKIKFGRNGIIKEDIPRHLSKSPADVVSDYLWEVADAARRHIERENMAQSFNEFPIDLIITHPAEWDYRGRNLTFRAVNKAFQEHFPEVRANGGVIRLATEPEACAQYTMRQGQTQDEVRLKPGQCFIVVDAGGGTVDLVAYRVKQIKPMFVCEKLTSEISDMCGATCIDNAFLYEFLPQRLGQETYERLKQTARRGAERHGQGSHVALPRNLQILLNNFEGHKRDFGKFDSNHVALLNLVGDIPDDETRGIANGQLRIFHSDFENMFRKSVDGTIGLIKRQSRLVDIEDGRVKAIFMSGGFSQNPYLLKRVKQLARGWNVDPVRGKDCWTAVAQGGVLMGLGYGCHRPPPCIACPFHIGVVLAESWNEYDHKAGQKYQDRFDQGIRAKGNIKWIVAKGDLITENEPISVSQRIIKKFSMRGQKGGRMTLVFSLADRSNDLPAQVNWGNDMSTHWKADLSYDLTRVFLPTISNETTNKKYFQVEMHLDVLVTQRQALFEIVTGRVPDSLGLEGTRGDTITHGVVDFNNPRQLESQVVLLE